ncbi:MAG: glycosyltransferase [Proteobacteria bacterium]|nr:glycosyltransferase [Pseudomonadota bacterium]
MKKRQLLFVMDTFPVGGIAKSLLALLRELGTDEYDIDFLLMKREGELLPLLPDHVHLLPEPLEREFRSPHPKYFLKNLFGMPLQRWLLWMKFSLLCSWARLTGGLHKHICCLDQFVALHAAPPPKEYDAAVAYAGGRCIYYVATRVEAAVKVGYIHSDYRINEVDYMLKPTDMIYFPMMDHLVTISEQCLESLQQEFPMLASRCHVIENICSPKAIRSMADTGDSFADRWNGFRIVTMGRIDIQTKGLDLAVGACALLKARNIPIRWYVVGDSNMRDELQGVIDRRGLHDTFILLGTKINPYPFIKDCDVYVQPSRIEGKSVALDEAKALGRPIVVTCFSTVHDQFRDGETALIAEMTPESIAEKIAQLLEDKSLRSRLQNNLSMEKVGNVEQVELFKKIIAGK